MIHILKLLKTFKQGVLILHWVPQIMCPVLTVRSLEKTLEMNTHLHECCYEHAFTFIIGKDPHAGED